MIRTTVGLSVAALLSCIGAAEACSCRPGSVESAIAETAVVFEGEVVEVRMVGTGNEQVTTVKVLHPIKGEVAGSVEIATQTVSASCGYDFRSQDKQLTVGAYPGKNGGLSTNLCTMFLLNPRRP